MFLFFNLFISALLIILFFVLSKSESWERLNFSTFECGFSSYFFSRFSFSVHFFMVALMFLFLDLEICLIMPFMLDFLDNIFLLIFMFSFICLLLLGVVYEWLDKNIEWKN